MLPLCKNRLPKHLHISRSNSRLRLVPVAHLRTRHGPSRKALPIEAFVRSESVKPYEPTAENHLGALSPLTRNLKVPNKTKSWVMIPTYRHHDGRVFDHLSDLLKDGDVSGTTLWHFVRKSCHPWHVRPGKSLTELHNALLAQVLRRVLDEWVTEGTNSGSIHITSVLSIYIARKFMRRIDWIDCLGILAKTAYQKIKLHSGQPLEDALGARINDAIHLRTLCKAWRMFLVQEGRITSKSMTRASTYENLWPELRDSQASTPNTKKGTDFIRHFLNVTIRQDSSGDPYMDRHLAYASILTLVAFYSSMRTFLAEKADALRDPGYKCGQGNSSVSGRGDPSNTQPNWHSGTGQSTYWAPEIGLLSVSEASILYIIAQAAQEAKLNLTLLRITLGQMSLPESDTQEIAEIYQGFRLAVPALVAKFQDFTYDTKVSKVGLLRRYPLKAYLLKAKASNDSQALEHASAIADGHGATTNSPGDTLALVEAFLQIDCPRKALHHWNTLAQRGDLRGQAWKIWLDYAFQKKDYVAFETLWDKLRTLHIPPTSKMWYQRLFLLHQRNTPLAWARFCMLVRFSGKNSKLGGVHVPRIAPSGVDIDLFHLMIEAYLDQETFKGTAVAKAKETLELLRKQKGLEATRTTYLLFIEDCLKRGTRQSAIKWFNKGHSSQIKFLPSDYALLLEYDLATHKEGKPSPLSDFTADIRLCFNAISDTIRLVRGPRRSTLSKYQTLPSSANIEAILRSLPPVDNVNDDPEDPKIKEIQSLYAHLMHRLAQNFAEQPPDRAKTARLRLLLLLWDHCIITGIPPNTEMESILCSIVTSIHPGLQEKLMRGTLFQNYDVKDPISFHSYRFLRLIGPQWFSDRITSIPPGPIKSQLAKLPWNGYDAVTDEALVDAGIASQEDRRKVSDEIMTWKNEAVTKRAEAAKKKKDRQKQISERESQLKEEAQNYNDIVRELRCLERQQTAQIRSQERKVTMLLQQFRVARTRMMVERRAVFRALRLRPNNASELGVTTSAKPRPQTQRFLRPSKFLQTDQEAVRDRTSSNRRRRSARISVWVRMANRLPMVPARDSLRGRIWRNVAGKKSRDIALAASDS